MRADKQYTTGYVIKGDAKSGVSAAKQTREELEKLYSTKKKGGGLLKTLSVQQQQFNKSLKNAAHHAIAWGAGLATAQVGLSAMMRELDRVDRIGKLSDRIGASTEALSEYDHVAKLTGTTLEQLSTAWQRQTRRIAEAAKGQGEAKKALNELGLSAEALKRLAPEEQFEVLADALNGVESQADKVRLAMKFWDSEGVALLQTVKGGSQSLRDMRDRARELGQSLSAEQVDNVERFNDSLTDLGALIKGQVATSLADAADTMADFVQLIVDNADTIGSTIKTVAKVVGIAGGSWLAYTAAVKGYGVVSGIVTAAMKILRTMVLTTSLAAASGAGTWQLLNTTLWGTSLSATAASGALGKLKIAAGVLFAAFAGWQLGSWLREEFLEARLFGLAFVEGMLTGWEDLKYYFSVAMETISYTWDSTLGVIRQKFGDFLSSAAEWIDNIPGMGGLAQGMRNYAAGLDTASGAALRHLGRLKTLAAERDKEKKKIRDNISDMVDYEIAMENGSDELDRFNESLGGTKKNSENAGTAIEATTEKAQSLIASLKNEREALYLTDRQRAVRNNLLKAGADATDAERSEIIRLTNALYDEKAAIEELEERSKPFAKAWEEATKRIDSAFADAWKGAFDSFGDFADKIKDAFKNLLAELIHQATTKKILINLGLGGGTGGGLFSSLLGGGSGSGAGGSGGGLFSGVSTAWNAVKTGLGITAFYNAATTASAQGAGFWGAIDSGLGGIYNGGAAAGETVAPLSYQLQNQYGEQLSAIADFAKKAGPWMAALAGGIYGYEHRGWSSAASGAAGGYAGYQMGATYGSTFGPVGTVVGAALGALLGGAVGGRLFGTGWQTKNTGFALGIDDGELDGKTYENRKKDKSFFRGTKRRTNIEALDAETARILTSGIDATKATIQDYFATLGMTVEDSVLDAFSLAPTQINLSGLSDEEVGEAIDEWFGTVADGMTRAAQGAGKTAKELAVDLIKDATEWDQAKKDSILYRQDKLAEYTRRAGLTDETPDFDGIQTFDRLRELVTALTSVNGVLEVINGTLLDSSIVGAEVAESMIQMYGGLDGFQASVGTFYDLFFTDAEKFDDLSNSLAGTLEAMGLSIPGTREAFKQLVQETDRMTEAGRLQFAALLDLSPAMDQYYSYLEGLPPVIEEVTDAFDDAADVIDGAGDTIARSMDEVRREAQGFLSGALSGLSASINADKDAITGTFDLYREEALQSIQDIQDGLSNELAGYNNQLSGLNKNASELRSIIDSIGSAMADLQSTDRAASIRRREDAQGFLLSQIAAGRVTDASGLKSALQTLTTNGSHLYASGDAYRFDQARTRAALSQLKDISGDQLTSTDRAILSINSRMAQATLQAEAQIAIIEDNLEIAEQNYLDEIDRLDKLYDNGELQINALLGIDSSVLSVADAVASLNTTIAQWASQSITGVEGKNYQAVADAMTADGKITDTEALQAYAIAVSEGFSKSEVANALNVTVDEVTQWIDRNGLPQFSGGGIARGPATGYPVELHGTEAVIPLQNGAVPVRLSGGSDPALLEEVKMLRQELKSANFSIAKHTSKTANTLQRWERDGQPEVRS